jgi:hypothetical protein
MRQVHCPDGGDGGSDAFAFDCGGGEGKPQFRGLRGLRDGGDRFGGIAAEKLGLPIHDHLWGIGIVELQTGSVKVLALGELRGGEAVAPALAVPVIHVLFKDDDVGVGDRLLLLQNGKELVGGRAAGAALGGEELYENRGAGCGLSEEREGKSKEESRSETELD